MKKYLSLAASLLMVACSQKPGFEIQGTVADSQADGKQVYLVKYGEEAPIDSAVVTNGAFTFQGEQATPTLCVLYVGDQEMRRVSAGENAPYTAIFTLENARLQAVLNEEAPAVSGTPENDAFKALQDQVKGIRAKAEPLTDQLKSADEAVKEAAM